ncbi:MAG TPA: hypothetical protein VFQ04_03280 [Actinomycetes bacterium]|nr:hypothetical protein [Actinomycetes bacterium]
MPRPKPDKLHDELDALLDGRPVELTDELAPLVETADALRAELATLQLDPAVADRHLERVLQGSATVVQLPSRRQANGWDLRRRVAAVALAAALVLAPATMASAAALPGQAMYPFKLAIEQLRIASVQWSPSREAGERTLVADERLHEVQDLMELRMFNQLPNALTALGKAVAAAKVAVQEAAQEGEPVPGVAARLSVVENVGGQVVQRVAVVAATGSVNLPDGTRAAITAAATQTQDVLPPPDPGPGGATPTPTTSAGPADPGPDPTKATQPPPDPTSPPTTEAPPPTTSTTPPTTEPPTTEPATTESTATPGSAGGGDSAGAERAPAEDVQPPTLEVPAP